MSQAVAPDGGSERRPGDALGAAQVGARVVVRHLLGDGRASDVLGVLLAADDASVVVRRDAPAAAGADAPPAGDVVVARAAVVAARVVPPRRPR